MWWQHPPYYYYPKYDYEIWTIEKNWWAIHLMVFPLHWLIFYFSLKSEYFFVDRTILLIVVTHNKWGWTKRKKKFGHFVLSKVLDLFIWPVCFYLPKAERDSVWKWAKETCWSKYYLRSDVFSATQLKVCADICWWELSHVGRRDSNLCCAPPTSSSCSSCCVCVMFGLLLNQFTVRGQPYFFNPIHAGLFGS